MEQSTDGTRFPLWRALALGGFAAAAFTAIAIFGSPSSAHADDGATDPSLLGAVTEVVGSLDRPVDAVADVVDVVDTTVLAVTSRCITRPSTSESSMREPLTTTPSAFMTNSPKALSENVTSWICADTKL